MCFVAENGLKELLEQLAYQQDMLNHVSYECPAPGCDAIMYDEMEYDDHWGRVSTSVVLRSEALIKRWDCFVFDLACRSDFLMLRLFAARQQNMP